MVVTNVHFRSGVIAVSLSSVWRCQSFLSAVADVWPLHSVTPESISVHPDSFRPSAAPLLPSLPAIVDCRSIVAAVVRFVPNVVACRSECAANSFGRQWDGRVPAIGCAAGTREDWGMDWCLETTIPVPTAWERASWLAAVQRPGRRQGEMCGGVGPISWDHESPHERVTAV